MRRCVGWVAPLVLLGACSGGPLTVSPTRVLREDLPDTVFRLELPAHQAFLERGHDGVDFVPDFAVRLGEAMATASFDESGLTFRVDEPVPLGTHPVVLVARGVRRTASLPVTVFDGGPLDAGTPIDGEAADGGSSGDAGPTGLVYFNDFNAHVDGFEPADYGGPPGFQDARPETFGGLYDDWWTPDLGDADRMIAVFRSQEANSAVWRLRITNDGAEALSSIRLIYDVRVAWARYQGADPGDEEFAERSAQVSWFAGGGVVGRSPVLDNGRLGPSDRAVWLSRERSGQLGMLAEGVTHDIEVDVPPGGALRLEWGQELVSDGGRFRHLTVGIDNLTILRR
jgi:hypothetical protein